MARVKPICEEIGILIVDKFKSGMTDIDRSENLKVYNTKYC